MKTKTKKSGRISVSLTEKDIAIFNKITKRLGRAWTKQDVVRHLIRETEINRNIQ